MVKKKRKRRDAGRPRGAAIADAVLARTLEALVEHGIEKLSVERVASSAEVNKTSVYRRWPTKGALIAAALERTLVDVSLQLRDTGSLRGDLESLCQRVASLIDQPFGRELARAALSESAGPEIAALAARQLASGSRGPARELIERAIARGECRRGVDEEMLLSIFVGAILHRVLLERQSPSQTWIAHVVDAVLLGVAPRGASRP